jgi:hypothetical protein
LPRAWSTSRSVSAPVAFRSYRSGSTEMLALSAPDPKADIRKRGQASPDDGDALALTFVKAVAQAEVEERDEDTRRVWHQRPRRVDAMSPKYRAGCDKAIYRIPGQETRSVTASSGSSRRCSRWRIQSG